jgi:histidine triad (HIT) family protein
MSLPLPERAPCPFCENLAGRYPCAFLHRDEVLASFVNPRQYGLGSVLIIPLRHAPTIFDLTSDELAAINTHAQALARAIQQAYRPVGYNIFQNNGLAAGQSVPHFHLHIVPRHGDDSPTRIFGEPVVEPIPIEERALIAARIMAYLEL